MEEEEETQSCADRVDYLYVGDAADVEYDLELAPTKHFYGALLGFCNSATRHGAIDGVAARVARGRQRRDSSLENKFYNANGTFVVACLCLCFRLKRVWPTRACLAHLLSCVPDTP